MFNSALTIIHRLKSSPDPVLVVCSPLQCAIEPVHLPDPVLLAVVPVDSPPQCAIGVVPLPDPVRSAFCIVLIYSLFHLITK